MGYKLKDREGMARGVRRIVREELESAVAQLEGRGEPDADAAIHDARKSLKKARSALRLVREDVGADVRRRENAAMRDAGRRLSGMRDAHVLIETLDGLAEPRGGPRPPQEVVGALREAIVDHRERLRARAARDASGVTEVARELSEVLARSDDWPLDDAGFEAAGEGLQRIHRMGRAAMAVALEDEDPEAWHEWRKRVKDLWYGARILEPVAPAALGGLVAETDELSDVLGDHNDLSVLDWAIDEHGAGLDRGQVALLRATLERRRHELRVAAVPLGLRLYAEKPGAFARRVKRYWEARAAQEAASAHWMSPEVAARVRGLLVAKSSATAAESRRIGRELRELDFRIADFSDLVPRRRGGFSAQDFDQLVGQGVVRLGGAPAPGRPGEAPARPEGDRRAPRGPAGGDPLPTELARLALGLAGAVARRARESLPI